MLRLDSAMVQEEHLLSKERAVTGSCLSKVVINTDEDVRKDDMQKDNVSTDVIRRQNSDVVAPCLINTSFCR
jgi:hypothetical protein